MHIRPSILILDDDVSFTSALSSALSYEFELFTAQETSVGLQILTAHPIDCVLLDYDLGAENGHDALDQIRRTRPNVPVIVVSGRVSLEMALGFLNRQISAFIEKPPVLHSLREKIFAALPRRNFVAQSADAMGFQVDAASRCVRAQGMETALTPIEYKILCAFLGKPRQRVSRDEITQQVWGNAQLSRNTLDTHLGNLRRKVPAFGTRLKAVYGEGFCLET